jgi:hypothetical protein
MRPRALVFALALAAIPTAAGVSRARAAFPAQTAARPAEDDEPAPPPDPPRRGKKPGADAGTEGGAADGGAPEGGAKPPPVPKCISVRSQAIFSDSGYDHVVTLASSCNKDAQCQVATDVSTEVVDVELPAGETREVVTYRGSPASQFHAYVKCTLSK